MVPKSVERNKEAVAEKMRQFLSDGRISYAQNLLETFQDWLWSQAETKKRQQDLDKLLNEK